MGNERVHASSKEICGGGGTVIFRRKQQVIVGLYLFVNSCLGDRVYYESVHSLSARRTTFH